MSLISWFRVALSSGIESIGGLIVTCIFPLLSFQLFFGGVIFSTPEIETGTIFLLDNLARRKAPRLNLATSPV